MSENIVLLETVAVDDGWVVSNLTGVEKIYQFNLGLSRASGFVGAKFELNPEWPDNHKPIDAIESKYQLLIISPRFAEFLKSKKLNSVELLPVEIITKTDGSKVGDGFILHPIDAIDCLDIEGSGAEFDMMDSDSVESLEEIKLLAERIPKDRRVFRVKGLRGALFFEKSLADEISSLGLSGFKFVALSEYYYI